MWVWSKTEKCVHIYYALAKGFRCHMQIPWSEVDQSRCESYLILWSSSNATFSANFSLMPSIREIHLVNLVNVNSFSIFFFYKQYQVDITSKI